MGLKSQLYKMKVPELDGDNGFHKECECTCSD